MNRKHVWDLIGEIKKERALLLTTHSMEEAEHLADRVLKILPYRQCLVCPPGPFWRFDSIHEEAKVGKANAGKALKKGSKKFITRIKTKSETKLSKKVKRRWDDTEVVEKSQPTPGS